LEETKMKHHAGSPAFTKEAAENEKTNVPLGDADHRHHMVTALLFIAMLAIGVLTHNPPPA
jgi:hypothetical protein